MLCRLKSLPVQLLLSLVLGFLLFPILSQSFIQFFYSLSVFLKGSLLFFLPFIILTFISCALLSFEQRAPFLIGSLILLVVASNAFCVMCSYGVACLFLPKVTTCDITSLKVSAKDLKLLFEFPLVAFISPDKAMMGGLVIGFMMNLIKPLGAYRHFLFKGRDYANMFLRRFFIPLLPFYIFGFILKIGHDGLFGIIVKNYSQIFMIICCLLVFYISTLYFIAARFNINTWFSYIKEMLPAGITGFSTMSSAAAMPLTLQATETNTGNKAYAGLVIPTTVNIHMMGDNLAVPLMGLSFVLMMGKGIPALVDFLPFVTFFCLAKFSSTAVPGGGVIVLLPVVEKYMGLPSDITALVATIYMLQDCLMTCANVMGNGAFGLISYRIFKPFLKKESR